MESWGKRHCRKMGKNGVDDSFDRLSITDAGSLNSQTKLLRPRREKGIYSEFYWPSLHFLSAATVLHVNSTCQANRPRLSLEPKTEVGLSSYGEVSVRGR